MTQAGKNQFKCIIPKGRIPIYINYNFNNDLYILYRVFYEISLNNIINIILLLKINICSIIWKFIKKNSRKISRLKMNY